MTTPDKEVNPTTDRAAGPWTTDGRYIRASERGIVSDVIAIVDGRARMTNEANAQFIVTACNAYEPMREALTDIRHEAAFLLDRLNDLDFSDMDYLVRDFDGHVEPSISRLRKLVEGAALSTLPVNDRHHSGSDSYQAAAGAPALFEKVNDRSEWLPIESAPHGPNLILAFRNDAGKWRRVIGWHAKQFEIEVDADELHSGLEEGPAGEAIYAKSGWYEYLDADEAPCNRIWPTHWMPLPSPPDAELNFSNNAERDGVSLKPYTSSQPASEADAFDLEAFIEGDNLEPGKLRPCPFCGGEAERIDFDEDDDEPENVGGSAITCKRCKCSTAVVFGYKETLVSSWNERAPANAQPASEAGKLSTDTGEVA